MSFRAILSPVFVVEWVVNARKWHGYAARFAFGLSLLAAISFAAWMIGNIGSKGDMLSVQNLAAFGEFIFNVMGTVQILMVLLAAPAATAGAICQDRARGALLHMMVTDLSVAEIVVGKLAARLVPVLCLVLCSFPVLALSSLLGGIDPRAIVLLLTISLALAVLGCSLALTLSLWMKNSYEVMVGVIGFWTLGLLAAPTWYLLATPLKLGATPTALLAANPFYLMHEIYSQARYPVIMHVIAFVVGSLIISGILVFLATRSFRAAVEQDGKTRNKDGMLRRLRRAALRWTPLSRPKNGDPSLLSNQAVVALSAR
ncbi:hypothetical protein [Singulisphaera sp. PoT]|uniref:hypothetical protein n=1 Tax=Singulisphaera sp. PoT TaxID=3411797 RepID=UPI003BF52A5A